HAGCAAGYRLDARSPRHLLRGRLADLLPGRFLLHWNIAGHREGPGVRAGPVRLLPGTPLSSVESEAGLVAVGPGEGISGRPGVCRHRGGNHLLRAAHVAAAVV